MIIKRRITKPGVFVLLLLLLAGGAIMNVAVAWGVASLQIRPGSVWLGPDGLCWSAAAPEWVRERMIQEDEVLPINPKGTWHWTLGWSVLDVSARDEILQRQLDQQRKLGFRDGIVLPTAAFISAGLPLRTFRGEIWTYTSDRQARHPADAPGKTVGVLVVPSNANASLLPVRLIPAGFVFNSVFYAALIAGVFSVATRVRRFVVARVRMKRHCCPACGYSIARGVTAACSECGSSLPQGLTPGAGIQNDSQGNFVRVMVRIACWFIAAVIIVTLVVYLFRIWSSALPY